MFFQSLSHHGRLQILSAVPSQCLGYISEKDRLLSPAVLIVKAGMHRPEPGADLVEEVSLSASPFLVIDKDDLHEMQVCQREKFEA